MAKKRFHKGDRVEWNAHGGKRTSSGVATGTVVKRLTKPRKIKGHRVKASPEKPQYLVRSDNGGKAAHKPSALRRSATTAHAGASGSKAHGPTSEAKGRGSRGSRSARATRSSFDDDERRTIRRDFRRAVNLPPAKLERWLETDESRSVGQEARGSGESTGHASGRRIVEIRRTRQADLDDADYRHMRKVVGYVDRHLAQRPKGDVEDSRWRYSLMNWGHDPLRT